MKCNNVFIIDEVKETILKILPGTVGVFWFLFYFNVISIENVLIQQS